MTSLSSALIGCFFNIQPIRRRFITNHVSISAGTLWIFNWKWAPCHRHSSKMLVKEIFDPFDHPHMGTPFPPKTCWRLKWMVPYAKFSTTLINLWEKSAQCTEKIFHFCLNKLKKCWLSTHSSTLSYELTLT